MPLAVARKIVDFAYRSAPPNERVEIGFFGGEPLLEFNLIQRIVELIEEHPQFDPHRVTMTVVSNGTVFTDQIAQFLNEHDIALGISCDGPPDVHDTFRRFRDGRGSSAHVEATLRRASEALPSVMTNAVYGPTTWTELPRTVDYLSSLGVRQIYLTPDYSASWSAKEIAALPEIYGAVADRYVDYYLQGDPHFIGLIDSKIAVILRGGYAALERCRMGRGEFAFTPEGRIYPCERLVGDGLNAHSIGDVERGIQLDRMLCHAVPESSSNSECSDCGLRDYCMNWCGCSNFFASGFYNRVSPFQCASEKCAIEVAFRVFQELQSELGCVFSEHISGAPQLNSLLCRGGSTP